MKNDMPLFSFCQVCTGLDVCYNIGKNNIGGVWVNHIEYTQSIPVAKEHDVAVAGGGLGGVAAALAARRAGKSVLLVEKSTILGGLATLGLINFFVPMCDGNGHAVIRGLCRELLELSIRYGYDTLPETWRGGEAAPGEQSRYVTQFSHSIFALALTEMVVSEGIDLLFDTAFSAPLMRDGRCLGLITESKSGREFHPAGVVVDATGDADVLFRAGVPTVQGKNYFTYLAKAIDIAHCKKAAASGRIQDAYYGVEGGGATWWGANQPENEPYYLGTDARDVTEYLVRNQRLLLSHIRNDPRDSRDVAVLPGMAQLRTTRRLAGDFTLTTEDVFRSFPDSVGVICDFEKRGDLYEIPLRTLTRRDFPNLITCGRSVSAAGYAWDVTRVIPPAILTGQAAGVIAAQAISENCAVSAVNLEKTQATLARQDVWIHIPENLRPKTNTVKN